MIYICSMPASTYLVDEDISCLSMRVGQVENANGRRDYVVGMIPLKAVDPSYHNQMILRSMAVS